MLDRQQVFIDELVRLVKLVAKESGGRLRKLERFQQLLADPDRFRFQFTAFEPLPFPLDPSILITGIRPNQTILFKSALMPAKLTFTTTTGVDYVAIFKYGDDLRQDQLVMQIIQLMDRMMRDENMDLRLTPYRVLATGIKHGFLQFVPSVTVAEVCATHGSIYRYFLKQHVQSPDSQVFNPEALDNYTRSLAGYCVITYLLGEYMHILMRYLYRNWFSMNGMGLFKASAIVILIICCSRRTATYFTLISDTFWAATRNRCRRR